MSLARALVRRCPGRRRDQAGGPAGSGALMRIVAILLDGPLKGQRRHIDTDYYGRVPQQLDVHVAPAVAHRYIAAGASSRANAWNYRYVAPPPVAPPR